MAFEELDALSMSKWFSTRLSLMARTILVFGWIVAGAAFLYSLYLLWESDVPHSYARIAVLVLQFIVVFALYRDVPGFQLKNEFAEAKIAFNQFYRLWSRAWITWGFFYVAMLVLEVRAVQTTQPTEGIATSLDDHWLWQALLNTINNIQSIMLFGCYEIALRGKKINSGRWFGGIVVFTLLELAGSAWMHQRCAQVETSYITMLHTEAYTNYEPQNANVVDAAQAVLRSARDNNIPHLRANFDELANLAPADGITNQAKDVLSARVRLANVVSAFQWSSALAGGLAIVLLVARLSSSLIPPHPAVTIALSSYALLQGAYSVIRRDPSVMILLTGLALAFKCLLWTYIRWLSESGYLLYYFSRSMGMRHALHSDRRDFMKLVWILAHHSEIPWEVMANDTVAGLKKEAGVYVLGNERRDEIYIGASTDVREAIRGYLGRLDPKGPSTTPAYFRIEATGKEADVLAIRRLEQFREQYGRLPTLNEDADTLRRMNPTLDLQIRGAVSYEPLDNFDGWVCFEVLHHDIPIKPDLSGRFQVESGRTVNLHVRLLAEAPADSMSTRLLVDSGRYGAAPQFVVTVESDEVIVTPKSLPLRTEDAMSESARFVCSCPNEAGDYVTYLQASQKGRLCQVVLVLWSVVQSEQAE